MKSPPPPPERHPTRAERRAERREQKQETKDAAQARIEFLRSEAQRQVLLKERDLRGAGPRRYYEHLVGGCYAPSAGRYRNTSAETLAPYVADAYKSLGHRARLDERWVDESNNRDAEANAGHYEYYVIVEW